jgi:hypothetical protein
MTSHMCYPSQLMHVADTLVSTLVSLGGREVSIAVPCLPPTGVAGIECHSWCDWVLVVGFGEVESIQLPPVS